MGFPIFYPLVHCSLKFFHNRDDLPKMFWSGDPACQETGVRGQGWISGDSNKASVNTSFFVGTEIRRREATHLCIKCTVREKAEWP